MLGSTLLGHTQVRRFVPHLWIRRCIGALPYICALGAPINWNGSLDPVYWVLGLSSALAVHFVRRSSLVLAFNPKLLAAMPTESAARRYSESAYYLLPAILQELLFRGVLITALAALNYPTLAIIAVSAVLFVVDHLFTKNVHVRPSALNLLTWAGPGVVWAGIVTMGGSIWIAVCSHTLLNLPAVVLPHLRGRPFRSE